MRFRTPGKKRQSQSMSLVFLKYSSTPPRKFRSPKIIYLSSSNRWEKKSKDILQNLCFLFCMVRDYLCLFLCNITDELPSSSVGLWSLVLEGGNRGDLIGKLLCFSVVIYLRLPEGLLQGVRLCSA